MDFKIYEKVGRAWDIEAGDARRQRADICGWCCISQGRVKSTEI